MNRAVIYARYSSDKQRSESVDAQIRACERYAEQKNIKVVGYYKDEAISGKASKTIERKEYQRLKRDCDKGTFEIILVHKYDRIARSLNESARVDKELHGKGITLVSISEDFGDNIVVKAVFWAMAENYIVNLGNETRKGLQENALKGLHTGGVAPFGYDVVDKKYVINELEASYVKRFFRCAAERTGYKDVLTEMTERGIYGKRGKPLRYSQVYEILRNEKYTGIYAYSVEQEKDRALRRSKPNAIRIPNVFPAIIEKPLFDEVQQIMDGRKQTGAKSNYLCSGLVYCHCGAKMHVYTSTRKGHTYKKYRCSKKCGARGISIETVDRTANQYLKDLLSTENQKAIALALRKYQAGESDTATEFKRRVQQAIQEKQREYDSLMANLSSGALPPEVVTDVGEKMKELKAGIESLQGAEPPKDFTVEHITNWLEGLKSAPDEEAVHLLIERIEVTPVDDAFDVHIVSTLNRVLGLDENKKIPTTSEESEVVGKLGCGGRI